MSTIWTELRRSRTQVALEAVLLRAFSAPNQVLERRIIQSEEFRARILPAFADYSIKKRKAFTETNLSELTNSKVPRDISEDCAWLVKKLGSMTVGSKESRPAFPMELTLSGPKYPFKPRDLSHLQRKTDTLTGRELTRPIEVESLLRQRAPSVARLARRRREQLQEYQWKVSDDDDSLQDDVLAPRYSSF